MRTGKLAAMVVSLLAVGSVRAGEPPVHGEIQRPVEAEDGRVPRFVAAYRAVQSIRNTPSDAAPAGTNDFAARLEHAVREAGLTVEEYESIASEARFNQTLRDRIFRILNREGGTEGPE